MEASFQADDPEARAREINQHVAAGKSGLDIIGNDDAVRHTDDFPRVLANKRAIGALQGAFQAKVGRLGYGFEQRAPHSSCAAGDCDMLQ